MDNVEEYGELIKLLAKCKFNICKQMEEADKNDIGYTSFVEFYNKNIKSINEFIVDVPIILEGGED